VAKRLRAADHILITCEHGGNRVPAEYRVRFAALKPALASHRGFDAGALVMARDLARAFDAPLVHSTVTRLLVDLNRSVGHRWLFSEAVAPLRREERARIVHRWHHPYWNRVEDYVRAAQAHGSGILHISSHSFTPTLDGAVRTTDIGLLYDPARSRESALACRWQQELRKIAPFLSVRRNYPYRGMNDGLTTHLRRRFPATTYVGLELEVNQALMGTTPASWREARFAVITALRAALAATGMARRSKVSA
jgi:predicted N-formylglutamate amidohydrolase